MNISQEKDKCPQVSAGPMHHDTNNINVANATTVYKKNSTRHDEKDMDRMGKMQELRRNFRFFTIFSYAVILGSTWQYALTVIGIELSNGGPAGGIWMFLVTCFGMLCTTTSMAEMASMMPISGGQYHWVSELAPKKRQKFLSYIVGWMCAIGWQSAVAVTALATTQQLQGLIALNASSYTIKPWQTTLFTIAIAVVCVVWNTFFSRRLPLVEGIAVVLYFIGVFVFIVILWVMAPHTGTKNVWTKFEDNTGWGNLGLSTLVGLLGPVVTLVGSDSSCHLSEETVDAAWVLPRAMMATALINYTIGFVTTLTVMSSLGSDVDTRTILNTPLGQPWIQVLLNATKSHAGTSVIAAVVCTLFVFCSLNVITTASRQLFALARDNGLPFSNFLGKVNPTFDVPVNALLITFLITVLLSLILLGSTIAFNIMTSLSVIGLVISYHIAISCMLIRRIQNPDDLLRARFSLGRAGVLINVLAICFLSLMSMILLFPAQPRPGLESMNWTCVMFPGLVAFALVWYWIAGRFRYVGPVMSVKERQDA